MRPKWDRKQAGSTYGAISIRNTVNTCASVYIPVNAQDIVDEEFANLDPDDKEPERPPDISKLTLSLEEMAPHTNPRYGRDEIGLGNMFADFFKPIARYNSERGIWFVYDGVVWQPDMENLKVAELAKLLADKLYLFALKITEEDARKRFIDRVRKLQQRKHRDTMLKDAKSVFPLSMKQYDQDIYLFNCKTAHWICGRWSLENTARRIFSQRCHQWFMTRRQTAHAGGRSLRRSCRAIRQEQTIFRKPSVML